MRQSSMEALKDSNEHARYAIAYRIYRMVALMEQRAYTMTEMGELLGVTPKTARRMMQGLELMGIPFFEEETARWRILR